MILWSARITARLALAAFGCAAETATLAAVDDARYPTPRVMRVAAGAEGSLRVRIPSGAFARAYLESTGSPVELRVRGPDGGDLVPARRVPLGASSCSWIAAAPGDHVVVLASSGNLQARVRIDFTVRRVASEADVRLVERENRLEQAVQPDSEADPGDVVARVRESLSGAALGPCDALTARRRAGAVLRDLGRVDEVVPLLERAVDDAARCGRRHAEALTWLELASAQLARGSFDAPRRALERAARAAAAAGDPDLRADVELGRAQLETYDMNVQSAARRYERARSIYQRSGNAAGEGRAWLWLAYNHITAGAPERALEAGGSALRLWEAIGDRRSKGRALQALGLANQSLGRTQKALALYLEARNTFSPRRDSAELAVVFNGLAELYLESGALDRGVEFARLAAELNAGRPSPLADSLCILARGLFSLGLFAESERHSRHALTIYKDLRDPRRSALAQRDLARALRARGESPAAIPLLQETLAVLAQTPAPYLEALVLSDLGDALAEQGDLGPAIERFERALLLQRRIGSAPDEALILANLARLRSRTGQLSEALRDSSLALARIEELRAALASYDLRTSYFASMGDFHEFHVDLLMRLHHEHPDDRYDRRAFQASELSRARTFVERLADSEPAGGAEALRRQEKELRARVDLLARRIARSDGDAGGLERLLRLYTQARAEHDQVESAIRASDGGQAAVATSDALDVGTVQASLLDDDTALVEYFVGESRSFAWVVTRNSFASYVLPPRAALKALVERVDVLVRSPVMKEAESVDEYLARVRTAAPAFEDASRELSSVLLGSWLGSRPERRLVVVAHEALHRVPFATLPWEAEGRPRPLLATRELVRISSAAALSVLRAVKRQRPGNTKGVLVVADPVFSPSDLRIRSAAAPGGDAQVPGPDVETPLQEYRARGGVDLKRLNRLTASGEEALDIAGIAGRDKVTLLRGTSATRSAVLSRHVVAYDIVHFASHSVVDDERPELSAVVLSMVDERGRPIDGLLLLDDLYRTKLAADLVVLSACDTALGRDVRGEGIVGFTRAFFHAGARRVIATLWKVDDTATRALMREFYDRMLRGRLSPAAALREAQLWMLARPEWAFPYYWAGFELHGDWR